MKLACPKCGSSEIMGCSSIDPLTLSCTIDCYDCGTWYEVYVEIKKIEEMK